MGRFNLGNNKYAVVSNFAGHTNLHIRQYKEDKKTGKFYPTKLGATLNPSRFASLISNLCTIDEKLNDVCKSEPKAINYKLHLGGGWYCTIKTGIECINIRKYFVPEDKSKPVATRTGIVVKQYEWNKFKEVIDDIKDLSPLFMFARECYFGEDHQNQLASLDCAECYPFGLDISTDINSDVEY